MKINGFRDVIIFGRVLSAGIVVAGYAFLGVWLSNWLASEGWPLLLSLCAVPAVTVFGMWQGWLFLTKGRANKNPPGHESQRDSDS